ncbi:MAG: ParB/RepB/Spo0J family partition protein [Roseinatronobacter sp.]
MITLHPTITDLGIDEIKVLDTRLRPVSEATVTVLVQVIQEHGFTVPVLVRKTKKGFVLIDGAHRLVAMQRLGNTRIPVVAASCTDDEARALESSQNLAGASLSPLDDAVFLAAYADAYQKLHPETTRGAAGAVARWDATELSSFAEAIAEKRAITVRQVRKIAAAGRALKRAEVSHLRSAPTKVTLSDITLIGKIADPEERAQVVMKLAWGNAKNAATARKQWRAEQGETAPVENPVEAAFQALAKAWARAPMAARKRFLLEHAKDVWGAQNKGVALTDWAKADDAAIHEDDA